MKKQARCFKILVLALGLTWGLLQYNAYAQDSPAPITVQKEIEAKKEIEIYPGQKLYMVNGEKKEVLDKPEIHDKKTMVTASFLNQVYGIRTDKSNEKIDFYLNKHSEMPELVYDAKTKMLHFGENQRIDFPAVVINKEERFPLATLFQVIGVPYEWNQQKKAVVTKVDFDTFSFVLSIPQQAVAEKKQEQKEKTTAQNMIDLAKTKLGAAYVYGSRGPNAFDCSGFVHWVYNASGYKNLKSGGSQGIYESATKISEEDLQEGDLLFYKKGKRISHVAIYIGNNKIIHADGEKWGVKISDINERYLKKIFYSYGRIK